MSTATRPMSACHHRELVLVPLPFRRGLELRWCRPHRAHPVRGNYCGDACPIYGSKHKIPAGSFWARWDDVRERYMVAIGGGRGFMANAVPRWSLASII